MTATQDARSTDGDLVIALNTPSTFTTRVAPSSSTGLPEPNLAWKDTVLVRAGEVVNILFDVSAQRWMAHCHIAAHIESGRMFSFDVLQREPEVIR